MRSSRFRIACSSSMCCDKASFANTFHFHRFGPGLLMLPHGLHRDHGLPAHDLNWLSRQVIFGDHDSHLPSILRFSSKVTCARVSARCSDLVTKALPAPSRLPARHNSPWNGGRPGRRICIAHHHYCLPLRGKQWPKTSGRRKSGEP